MRIADTVNRTHSKVILFTPQDPEKDALVDAAAAERRLFNFFPQMHVYPIGGEYQQHAVTASNKFEYQAGISHAIAAPR